MNVINKTVPPDRFPTRFLKCLTMWVFAECTPQIHLEYTKLKKVSVDVETYSGVAASVNPWADVRAWRITSKPDEARRRPSLQLPSNLQSLPGLWFKRKAIHSVAYYSSPLPTLIGFTPAGALRKRGDPGGINQLCVHIGAVEHTDEPGAGLYAPNRLFQLVCLFGEQCARFGGTPLPEGALGLYRQAVGRKFIDNPWLIKDWQGVPYVR